MLQQQQAPPLHNLSQRSISGTRSTSSGTNTSTSNSTMNNVTLSPSKVTNTISSSSSSNTNDLLLQSQNNQQSNQQNNHNKQKENQHLSIVSNEYIVLENMNEQLRTITSKNISTFVNVYERINSTLDLLNNNTNTNTSNTTSNTTTNTTITSSDITTTTTPGNLLGNIQNAIRNIEIAYNALSFNDNENNDNNTDNNNKNPNDSNNGTTKNSSTSTTPNMELSKMMLVDHPKNVKLFTIISQQHRIRRKVLLQHTSILELFELPNLMDICIRSIIIMNQQQQSNQQNRSNQQQQQSNNNNNNNTNSNMNNNTNMNYDYYDEAIQIATFANTLERRHGIYTNTNTNTNSNNNNNDETTTITNTTTSSSSNTTNTNTIIQYIIEQIRLRQNDLYQHLLQQLQYVTTMNECLEIITALRRFNNIIIEQIQINNTNNNSNHNTNTNNNIEQLHINSEYQLQIAFLEARDVWINNTTTSTNTNTNTSSSNITSGTTTTTITSSSSTTQDETIFDMIERYRTRMFEVITQYNAIFHSTPTSTTTTSTTSKTLQNQHHHQQQLLLSLWITRRIQYFLQFLRYELTSKIMVSSSMSNTTTTNNTNNSSSNSNLTTTTSTTNIDTAMIRDIIEASIFFANSLGRMGGDFTYQLQIIYEPIIIHLIVNEHWKQNGVIPFCTIIDLCRTHGIAHPLMNTTNTNTSSTNVSSGTMIDTIDTTMFSTTNTSSSVLPPLEEPQPPPKYLLSFPPLARFVNAILIGLNELRRCLLPNLFPILRRSLQNDIINNMEHILQDNERAVLIPGLQGDAIGLRTIAVQMKNIFHDIVIPYIYGSYEAAIGYKVAAKQYHEQLYINLKRLHEIETNRNNENNNNEASNDNTNKNLDNDNIDTNDENNNLQTTTVATSTTINNDENVDENDNQVDKNTEEDNENDDEEDIGEEVNEDEDAGINDELTET